MEISSRIEKEFLPFVNKPGRYIGNEYNVVVKNPEKIDLHFALAFPEIYELGMSYVGFDILYHILNAQTNIWAERVYSPWLDAEQELRSRNLPLFSLESKTPLNKFDIVGFTLQYELCYSNILNMLDLAGIPFRSSERTAQFPLIIAGGPSACNPEPLADFFDAILIGDGEQAVLDICRVVMDGKKKNLSKNSLLQLLLKIKGIYIPKFYSLEYDSFGDFKKTTPKSDDVPLRISKSIIPRLQSSFYPLKPLVPLIEITHDRLSLEIMRGCSEGCRFCNAGMVYRPVRERSAQDILEQTRQAIDSTGFNEVSLLSLNTSDYSDLNWLMMKEKLILSQQQVRFSFPSLRLDALTLEMVDFVQTVKKTGFTFAPEAGSPRLRNVINKNIQEKDLLNTLKMVLENGWQSVKLYFLIGLPTEKDEDIIAIVDLIKKCHKIAGGYKKVSLNVSISPFSPKPHTPFQWEKQENIEELDRKIRMIRENLPAKDINLSWRDGFTTSLETVFTRGGRELADVLETAWRKGARLDAWNESFNADIWLSAFEETGISWMKYLKPLSVSMPLPWDHIDMGISGNFLQQEKLRAYEGRVSRDCREYVCLGCGLQRKEFQKLVDCYLQQKPDKKGKVVSEYRSDTTEDLNEGSAGITFGRGTKRRIKPTTPVRKKIRLQYSKVGSTRFLSHLDIVRIFDRAARRAKISLIYSQGFTPRPKLSFASPIGLGIASIAEYMDLEAKVGTGVDVQKSLNSVLPQGIEVLMHKTIFKKVAALAAVINRWSFETFLEDFDLPEERLEDWWNSSELVVERMVKEKSVSIDIKPFIEEVKLNQQKLFITINRIEGRMVKITEVLESLFGKMGVNYRRFITHRTGQFIVDNGNIRNPFEII